MTWRPVVISSVGSFHLVTFNQDGGEVTGRLSSPALAKMAPALWLSNDVGKPCVAYIPKWNHATWFL